MPGKALGTVWVELDLSTDAYTKKEKEVLRGATTTSLEIEKNWRTLGSHSDKIYDAMRQQAINSFNAIANSSKSSAAEIIRAEEAKNAKIKQLNEHQYGQQTSLISTLKGHWLSATAAIAAAWYAVSNVLRKVSDLVMQGVRAIDSYNLAAIQTAAIMTGMMQPDKRSLADKYKEARTYADQLNDTLEQVDKQTMLNFKDLQNITLEMMKQGVVMDVNSQAEIKAFTQISNALAVISSGYPNKEIQLRQEIRSLLNGQVRATDQLSQMLDAQLNGKLKEQIQLHKKSGDLIIWLGEELKGFAAAQGDINASWETAKSTLETTYNQVLRQGFQSAYKEIIAGTQELSAWAIQHKTEIGEVLTGAWNVLKFAIWAVVTPLQAIANASERVAKAWGEAAYNVDLLTGEPIPGGTAAAGIVDYVPSGGTVAKPKLKPGGPSDEEAARIKHAKTVGEQLIKESQKVALSEIEYINWMAGEYQKMGVDKTIIANWTSVEIEKINQKEADKVLKIQQDANEAIGKHRESATKEYEKLLVDEADFAMTENERAIAKIVKDEQDKLWKINVMLQEETISWGQYEMAKAGITTNAAKARLTNETENAKRIAGINYNLIQDIMGMEETAFNLRMTQIEAEKNKYIADGGDIVHAAKWAADQQTKALIKLGKTGNNISGGMSAAFQQLYLDQLTYGQAGYDMMNKTFQAGATAWGDTYYSVIVGDINSLQDIWDSAWQGMLRSFTDILGQMTMQWGMSKMGALFDSGGTITIDKMLNGNESAAWGDTKTAGGEITDNVVGSSDEFASKVESSSSLWQMMTKESAGLFGEQVGLAGEQFTSILGSGITSIFGAMGIGVALGGGIGGNTTGALIGSLAGFALLGPLGAIGGGLIGGFFHEGGIVGQTAVPQRMFDPSIFANAPRLHSGLRSDEFPAILQKGEKVIPKNKPALSLKSGGDTYNFYPRGNIVTMQELARDLEKFRKKAQKEGAH